MLNTRTKYGLPIPKNALRKSSAASSLETVADVILALGVIASLICLVFAIRWGSFTIFVYSLLCILVTLLQWSFIKVFTEMATDIKHIRDKIN